MPQKENQSLIGHLPANEWTPLHPKPTLGLLCQPVVGMRDCQPASRWGWIWQGKCGRLLWHDYCMDLSLCNCSVTLWPCDCAVPAGGCTICCPIDSWLDSVALQSTEYSGSPGVEGLNVPVWLCLAPGLCYLTWVECPGFPGRCWSQNKSCTKHPSPSLQLDAQPSGGTEYQWWRNKLLL